MSLFAGGIGTYMKALPVSVCGLAVLWFLYSGETRKLKETCEFGLLYFMPLLLTLLLSLLIWAIKMEPLSAVSRGSQKLIFQTLNIFSVLAAAYLFRGKTVKYYFFGVAGANALICAYEMMRFGVGASVSSVIDSFFYGKAYGFIEAIEIHDITFALGALALYYMAVEWKNGWETRIYAFICMAFFVLGFKRIALLGFAFALVVWILMGRLKIKTRARLVVLLSWALALAGFGYVVFIKTNLFTMVCEYFDIDTTGRSKIYNYMNDFYTIDPTFGGYGFEYVVAMLRGMKAEGEQVIHVTGMHNDMLKQYIELGFWGFWAWAVILYVYQPHWFLKRYGERVARTVLLVNIYTFVTYLTDNTIYYFWLSMTLRVIPISFAFSDEMEKVLYSEYRERGYLSGDEAEELMREDFKK